MTQKIAAFIKANKSNVTVALIILSLIMLFVPWISVHVTVSGTRFTLEDALGLADYSTQEIQKEVSELEAEARSQGYDFDGSSMIRIVKCIRDSAFSPFELIRFMSSCRQLTRQYEKVIGSSSSDILMLKKATSYFPALEIFLLIILLADIVAGVSLILKKFRDNRKAQWLYCGCSIVIFAFFAILTAVLNSRSREASSILNDIFSSYSRGKTSLAPFHLTAWSFLFLLCAAGAAVLGLFFREGTSEPVKSISFSKAFLGLFDGRDRHRAICPHCGKLVKGDVSFCMFCGGKLKVEQDTFVNCVNCGAKVKKGTDICPNCGNDPSKKVEPDSFVLCVNCGAKVKKGTETCPNCGKDSGKKVETLDSFINCVHCDTRVKKGTAICPVCGKNPSEPNVSVTYNFFTEPTDL